MKLAFVIILASCLQVCAVGYSQDARVTIDLEKAPISRLFQIIEQQTEFKFVYANDFFPASHPVTIHAKESTVSEILNIVLQNTGFTFKKSQDLIIITSELANERNTLVKGTVTDQRGELLHGVTVTLENGKNQTATDVRGEFFINAAENDVLIFTSIGDRKSVV